MEEWLLVVLCAGLAAYWLLRPNHVRVPVRTTRIQPSPRADCASISSPQAFPSDPAQSSFSSLPSSGPMPSPPAIPLLSSSLVIPPYWRKPRFPTFSSEQHHEALLHTYKQLHAEVDSEEVTSAQQLLAGSYWTKPAFESTGFHAEEVARHRNALGKIVDALIALATEERKKFAASQPLAATVAAPPMEAAPLPVSQPAPVVAVSDNLDTVRSEMESTLTAKAKLPDLPSELNGDLNEVIGQITSDVSDRQHLSQCVQRCLASIQRFPQATEAAGYLLCEKVLGQCRTNVEDIENGPAFALNYTNFVMELSARLPNLQRLFRDLLYSKRKILVPTMITDPKEIDRRLHLQDVQPDAFESQMNLTRAYGALRAALNCHPGSSYGAREAWTWLARLLNTPSAQIDRLTIPALTGFLKVLRLQGVLQKYGKQGKKLVSALKAEYCPMLRARFWEESQLYHTSLVMLDRAVSDMAADLA